MPAGVSDAEIEVGEEIDVPKEDTDVRGSMDQSVSFFGSARRKRALSAAQRNRLETGALETALEPAFSHAETNIDNTPVSGWEYSEVRFWEFYLCISSSGCVCVQKLLSKPLA